jgi:uncharacterized damage-inducible protein DinB
MNLERYRHEMGYDAWANREVLRHLMRDSLPPPRCVRWLAHVVGAQYEWLARLEGGANGTGVWPSFTPDEIETALADLTACWSEWLERLTPERLDTSIEYVNTAGKRWTSRVDDVLTHVLLHGAYHRGQIAACLREEGLTPPATDYIHATRGGLLG